MFAKLVLALEIFCNLVPPAVSVLLRMIDPSSFKSDCIPFPQKSPFTRRWRPIGNQDFSVIQIKGLPKMVYFLDSTQEIGWSWLKAKLAIGVGKVR